jgi:hypothetical protein
MIEITAELSSVVGGNQDTVLGENKGLQEGLSYLQSRRNVECAAPNSARCGYYKKWIEGYEQHFNLDHRE